MILSAHVEKHKQSAVTGMQKHCERDGNLANKEIDKNRTNLNFEIIGVINNHENNLYQRVKKRVAEVGGRKIKSSIHMAEVVMSLPSELSEDVAKDYFSASAKILSDQFGKENIVGAYVHLDETTPHMHFYFVPVNQEENTLSCRTVVTRSSLNQMHNNLEKGLNEKGFEVSRGTNGKKSLKLADFKRETADELEIQVQTLENTKSRLEGKITALTETSHAIKKELDKNRMIYEMREKPNFLEQEYLRQVNEIKKLQNQNGELLTEAMIGLDLAEKNGYDVDWKKEVNKATEQKQKQANMKKSKQQKDKEKSMKKFDDEMTM